MVQPERAGRLVVVPGLLLVLLMLTVLTVSGCGSSPGPVRPPTTASATATGSASTSTGSPRAHGQDGGSDPAGDGSGTEAGGNGSPTRPGGSSRTTHAPTKNVIEWVLGLGVGAPSGPTGHKDDMYRALGQRRCEAVDADFPVLHAAAAACLAAAGTGDTDSLWNDARQVRDATDPASLDCLDAAAYAVLDALVDAHQARPDLPFELRTSDGTSRSTCLVVSAVEPAGGTSGGLVTVRGRNLDRTRSVELADPDTAADVTARIVGRTRTRLTFRLPKDIQGTGHNLRILWDQPTGESATWVPFDYGPGPTEDDSTTTEDEGPTAEQDSPSTDPGGPSPAGAPSAEPGTSGSSPRDDAGTPGG